MKQMPQVSIFEVLPVFLSPKVGQYLIRRLAYRFQRDGLFQNEAVIVGSNAEARQVSDLLLRSNSSGLRVSGYLRSGDCAADWIDGLSCLGCVADLETVVHDRGIRVLILVSSSLTQEETLLILRQFGATGEVDLRMSAGSSLPQLGSGEGAPAPLSLKKVRLTRADFFSKAVFDYCVAVPALIVLSPILAAIALAIRLSSDGPIFEQQKVLGIHGKPFSMIVFRTAAPQPERSARKNPLGRFLHATKLNRLPLLINVLRKEMSLVGSHAVRPDELDALNADQIDLLPVQPGITGLWCEHGCSEISINEQIRLDQDYINNWSILKDVKILINTVFLMFINVKLSRFHSFKLINWNK